MSRHKIRESADPLALLSTSSSITNHILCILSYTMSSTKNPSNVIGGHKVRELATPRCRNVLTDTRNPSGQHRQPQHF